MGVSNKNNGTPKSSILIGFSIINHPFWGTPIFGNLTCRVHSLSQQLRSSRIEKVSFCHGAWAKDTTLRPL